jgi:thiol-disulfide isomerase/thioredoxin
MRKFALAALFAVILAGLSFGGFARANDDHEYAPIQESAIKYKNWTFKSLDGAPVEFRQWAGDKKLVLVVYYAPWCGNWKYESAVVSKLYEKYKDKGFDVIAVNEYGTAAEAKTFFGEKGAPYTVVVESEDRAKVGSTTHFNYRRVSGDTRTWGSPYNVFLEPAKLAKEGDLLTERASIANGELVEADAEKFIREKLGLPAEAPAAK